MAFFDGLERAFGEADMSLIIGGTSFVKVLGDAFIKAGIEGASVLVLDALKAATTAAGALPNIVWKKLQEFLSKVQLPNVDFWDFLMKKQLPGAAAELEMN